MENPSKKTKTEAAGAADGAGVVPPESEEIPSVTVKRIWLQDLDSCGLDIAAAQQLVHDIQSWIDTNENEMNHLEEDALMERLAGTITFTREQVTTKFKKLFADTLHKRDFYNIEPIVAEVMKMTKHQIEVLPRHDRRMLGLWLLASKECNHNKLLERVSLMIDRAGDEDKTTLKVKVPYRGQVYSRVRMHVHSTIRDLLIHAKHTKDEKEALAIRDTARSLAKDGRLLEKERKLAAEVEPQNWAAKWWWGVEE